MSDIDPDIMELLKNHPHVSPERIDAIAAELSKPREIRRDVAVAPLDNVPEFMQRQRRWTVFKKRWNETRKKFDKVPCLPNGDDKLPAGYPNTDSIRDFGEFKEIKKLCELDTSFVPAYYLLKSDGILFLDFDPPCDVPDYPTYTERSISGGYHCLAWYSGAIPTLPGCKEIYADRRWIVVTGDIVQDKRDINDLTDLIIELNRHRGLPDSNASPKFKAPERVPAGERNTLLFRYGCSMRAKGSSLEAIFAALIAENKVKCTPPLEETEIRAIVTSINKYPAGEPPKRDRHPVEDMKKKKIYAGHSTGEFAKVQQALEAIVDVYNYPSPRVFVRGGKLCRIIYDENSVPSIDKIDESSLSVTLTECIDWYLTKEITEIKEGKEEKRVIEVLTTTPSLLVPRLFALGQWEGIPALSGIVESPYITDDGEIVSTPGYNPQTRLYLAQHQNFKGVSVPMKPTEQDVIKAKEKLFDLFGEFTFEDESSRENHVACLISSAIRPTIKGLVPLFVYDKPVMGSGASLLAELITAITTGRPASMTQAPDKNSEGEWNKLIIGLLREGRSINVFDNVEGDIYSAALAALLTSHTYRGRVLGKNATEEYPNQSIWIANGNNIQITHDLPRRCVWIRLATDTSRPFERTDWKIQNIREHAIANQSEYLSAILTIVRGWYLAGKPAPDKKCQVMGSFETWRNMLGGIMKFIGCTEFLANTSVNLDITEEAHEDIEMFLEELFYAFPSTSKEIKEGKSYTKSFSVKDINPVVDPANYVKGFGNVLADKMPPYLQEIHREHPKRLAHAIGNNFRKIVGRVFPNGYKLERGKMENKTATYKISYKQPVRAVKENP